jgi:predicted alpha/beta hydrolase family esterase
MKEKTQVMIIHGGMTFKNRKGYLDYLRTREISLEKRVRWTDEYLSLALGKNFEIIRPRMPLQDNARYEDWKIHFEQYIPHLRDGVVLIGNSLGGIFLAKYLSEHTFPKKIASLFLACPPFASSTGPTKRSPLIKKVGVDLI